MQAKEKFNLLLPVPLMREFEAFASRYGAKRKWMVLAASIKMLLESPEEKRDQYVRQIAQADLGGASSYEAMVDEINSARPGFGKLVHEREEEGRKRTRAKAHESR